MGKVLGSNKERLKMIKYFYSIIILFLIVMAINSCDNNIDASKPEPANHFQIDLQTWFSNTQVKILIDNSIVFNDTVTTGSILAYAAIIPVKINKGSHLLKITVDNTISKDTIFTITDSLYVGVDFSATNSNIMFDFQYQPFPYR